MALYVSHTREKADVGCFGVMITWLLVWDQAVSIAALGTGGETTRELKLLAIEAQHSI